MTKRPSFQFYPADWRKDPALSSCSLAARGLWIELMCVAHEAEKYGVLTVNGHAMTHQQIARAVGEVPPVVKKLLDELEAAGVFSRDESGAIYSRRMVKDEHIRDVRAKAGHEGWKAKGGKRRSGRFAGEFAQAKNQQPEQSSGDLLKQNDEQNTAPSSSSSEYPPSPPPDSGPGNGGKRSRRRLPATQAPDSFEVTDELAAWAVSQGLPEDRIENETLKMLNHFKAKGEPRSDWIATWRNWILKAVEISGRRAA